MAAGDVSVPKSTVRASDMIITQSNSYTDITLTIGTGWDAELDGSLDVYVSAKANYTDATYLFNKVATITDAAAGTITFDLTPTETDIPVGKTYWWQVQIRNEGATVVLTPLVGKLIVDPILRSIA